MSKKAEVTCSFIGLGLIGGSIVKALRQAYPEMILKAYGFPLPGKTALFQRPMKL